MSWVLLDDNFPNHPKAVRVGPVAAYLFICGLCYCRKHHTGGFIPANAVKLLGVTTNPRRMVDALIEAGLWERSEGGFTVHDYTERYDDDEAKSQIEEKSRRRREAGRKGGLARAEKAKQTPNASSIASSKTQPHRNGSGLGSEDSSGKEGERRSVEVPSDMWFMQLVAEYPQQATTQSAIAQHLFGEVIFKDGRNPHEVWAEMLSNLESQKCGEQWAVKRMIPRLDRWLESGLWKQQHPPAVIGVASTAKTAGNVDALRRFATRKVAE